MSVTHCETLHTIIIFEDEDDGQVGIYSQKKKQVSLNIAGIKFLRKLH